MAQKDILHRMIDRSSNLTRILSKLSTKSFVTICRSECDRREYKIRLTSESIALLETLQTTMLQSVDTFHGLSESEAFHLNALLDKMRETP